MTYAPIVSVSAAERLWQQVEHAYGHLAAHQQQYGDLSPQARAARRQVELAWSSWESGACAGADVLPTVVYDPLAGVTQVALSVDCAAVGYTVCVYVEHDGWADVDVQPEPVHAADVPPVLRRALGLLDAQHAGAVARGDEAGAAIWRRAHAGVLAYLGGWHEAEAGDLAPVCVPA